MFKLDISKCLVILEIEKRFRKPLFQFSRFLRNLEKHFSI